jgi:Family of unknown function (DUF5670)
MLEAIAIILLVLWLLGMVSGYTVGSFIHILLVIAIVIVLLRVIQGRRLI